VGLLEKVEEHEQERGYSEEGDLREGGIILNGDDLSNEA